MGAAAGSALAQDVGPVPLSFSGSYLHVDGTRLVSASGQEVHLHGVNVGGWLVMEDWMCGVTDDQDTAAANGPGGSAGRSALETLEQRFGPQQAAALMAAWQDHWMTAADLDQIRDSGFNLVRVPISYRTLQHADGGWILDSRGQIDFGRMDWMVREAAQRGIYTVFDLHVWPQQRTAYDKIGRPEGRQIRDDMARLWTAVAAHYRGNGAVAALDLINEFPGAWGVQQALSRAVAEGDPQRVQVIEGFTFAEFQALHAAGAFPNSVFSDHFYGDAPRAGEPLPTSAVQARLLFTPPSTTPIYIGEFLAQDFKSASQMLEHAGVSWSSWTYKTVDMGDWGIINYQPTLRTDLQRDAAADILARWSTDLVAWQRPESSDNWSVNEGRRFRSKGEPGGALR